MASLVSLDPPARDTLHERAHCARIVALSERHVAGAISWETMRALMVSEVLREQERRA